MTMKVLILFAATVVAVSAEALKPVLEEWEDFKLQYNKHYPSEEEEAYRFGIFATTYNETIIHNERHVLGLERYPRLINKFADILDSEIPTGLDLSELEKIFQTLPEFDVSVLAEAPESMDWREMGIITPVEDQKQCKSCWAFAAAGALEAYYKKNYGVEQLMSEQYLVDCISRGCEHGGNPATALLFVEILGIPSETAYPYRGISEECHYFAETMVAKNRGVHILRENDENDMKQVVGRVGPVVAVIYADSKLRNLHANEIYHTQCQKPNHVVLIVGYGTSPDGEDYWIAKNSWGAQWGDKGYFKTPRNKNYCGISSYVMLPVDVTKV